MFHRRWGDADDGPPTVLQVLSSFDKTVKGKTIDLSKTYTTSFVKAVPATN